jgi:hypothetical protein
MKDVKELAKEIVSYFEILDDNFERAKIQVVFNEESQTCTVHIAKMYEGLGNLVSFKALSWLSEQLNTEEIDLKNESYYPGCESCDWGSEHSVDIVCVNIKL